MNERIKELATQAGLSYLYDYDADGHAMVCSEKDIKKFAELMIEEFQTILRDNKGADTGTLSYRVEEHFGDKK